MVFEDGFRVNFVIVLLSFCYRFVHADIPTNTQRNAKHVTNMDESHTGTTSARIMMVTYVDTYIHIHTYVYIYIYMYTHMHVYIYNT